MAVKYAELVVDGPRGWDIGFIRGFLRAKGLADRVLNAEAEGFDCRPPGTAAGAVAPRR